ncbi:MAG: hypothetical protein LKI53_01240 [Bacteroidales bacterium]|jgi:CRISPR-associated protein Csc3|nr:hypothetical protein [Bacteroidales bacterium]
MEYKLIEQYFDTEIFQNITQLYFDTILQDLLVKYPITEAKGLFVIDNKVRKDDYDMPYHIHILNGLIPSLLIYEKYLAKKGWIENKEAELYIKTFILGYTFHDANKLLKAKSLQEALKELDKTIGQNESVKNFFPEFEKYKGDVYYLCLSDEDRTSVLANQYKISLSEIHMKEVLAILCKFADKIASNQNFDSVEEFYNSISKSLSIISGINRLPISYVEVNPNPYILLSQNILQSARKVMAFSGKKVFQALRNGFIYFGEDLTKAEVTKIQHTAEQVSEDIDPVGLTKIDAQKCSFGFIGSVEFKQEVLEKIIEEKIDSFFALSPNGNDKISDFSLFVEFNNKLIEIYGLPIKTRIQNNKLYLNVDKESYEDWSCDSLKIYCLNKIQWLNAKQNKAWKNDFDEWLNKNEDFPLEIQLKQDDDTQSISNTSELKTYIEAHTNSSNALLKTYLGIVKTYSVIKEMDEDDMEEYINQLENEIIHSFTGEQQENTVIKDFFNKYFNYRGNNSMNVFDEYNPIIPEKGKMCAFTGGVGLKEYKEDVAFSMKARGFSNRTITSLNNTTSHISDLYAEENKLRKSQSNYPKDANVIIYNDFFETTLGIDRNILIACAKAKNIQVLNDTPIQFDKNAKFQYNLYNLNFDKIASGIEANFYYVRKSLLLIKTLGIRSYITGVMSPYQPHKEVFRYENAPRFLRQLGWDRVRLINIDKALEEISLILTLGSNRLEGNLLQISENRNKYFSVYYLLKEDDKKKVYEKLKKFINNNPNLFTSMTVTENLAELATKITTIGYNSSGSEETWLIRTALDFVRKEVKQGYDRDNVIQRTSGNIYKSLRLDYVNMEAIKDFATAVYDELYKKEWKGTLPNLNREKDWIYQFAFVYKEKCAQKFDENSANKIAEKLKKEGKEITEENIKLALKGDSKEKYTDKYINLILNK